MTNSNDPITPLTSKLSTSKGAWTAAIIVMAISLLSTFTLATPNKSAAPTGPQVAAPQDLGPAGTDTVTDPAQQAAGPSGGAGVTGGGPAGGKTYDCSKGQNAGATDVGVTAKSINFAATVVKTGIAKDFLTDAQYGIEAVKNKVNRAGGICGRIINVAYLDDGWEPNRGANIIQGWIGEKKYFGLAVNPSSEGLKGAIDGGYIRNAGFPVIGADGMLIDQYKDPYVWPIAISTSSIMHIMAQKAYADGARTFGIAWESNYRFGVEGHDAFVGAVKRLGGTISSDVGIQGGLNSYKTNADQFITSCGGANTLDKCDFMAMLLEPNTATQWVRDGGLGNPDKARPKFGIGGPQPLFLRSFGVNCGKACANMTVWSSFKPPIPPFDTEPAVVTYKNDMNNVSSTADKNNPHVEGAYVGMLVLVEALKRLGPSPTRAAMKSTLDSLTLDTGLAPTLSFRPGNHFSNTSAQAFKAIVNNGSFSDWQYTQSGFLADREVGKDIP
ncbi:MAG: ABC transporter substrate-binding protein [Actinomycetota bacterium]